jgi:membrane fusion protein (multidrug efflux system)
MDDVRQPAPLTNDEASVDSPPKRGRIRAFLLLGVVGLLLLLGGVLYWLDARHYESTDDAFIDGHISQVSAQVGGRVIALGVADNEMVRPGDVLVQLDPRDFQVKLDQEQAQRAEAQAQLEQARATMAVRRTDIEQAEANIRVAAADLMQQRQDLARYRSINPRAITRQTLDAAAATTRAAQARLDANTHAAAGMRAQLAVAQAQIDAEQAALRMEDANIANARLQLSYTNVVAPAAGRVTKRTVELGNYVSPGQSLLAIVPTDLWVTANFKETQLTDMRPGESVRISVDAFPARSLAGHVDSLQSGTGSVFSSLPAENATGNYVKVVQRLPVKILFDGDEWRKLALAPGMSVEPRVTVR